MHNSRITLYSPRNARIAGAGAGIQPEGIPAGTLAGWPVVWEIVNGGGDRARVYALNEWSTRVAFELENRGGHPQNVDSAPGEVVLTRAESDFLALCLSADASDPDFAPTPDELSEARKGASLTAAQGRFVQDYLRYKGDVFDLTDLGLYEPSRLTRHLANPAVFRILTEVSRLRPDIPPPIPSKEELAVTWGMVSRDGAMPLTHQREARQELAKLMGYYPNGGDGVNVGVQVVLRGDLTDD